MSMSISNSTLKPKLRTLMRCVLVVGISASAFISVNRSLAREDARTRSTVVGQQQPPTSIVGVGAAGIVSATTTLETQGVLPTATISVTSANTSAPPPVKPPENKPDLRAPSPPQDIKTEYGEKDWQQPIDPNAKIDESLRDGKPK